MLQTKRHQKLSAGFTLIELLIVISIMGILTTVVFVALNPMARFQDSRNARRWADVNAILSAIKLDQVDHDGAYLPSVEAMTANTYYQIGDATTGCNTSCLNPTVDLQTSCVELYDLIDRGYIADIPYDPNYPNAGFETSGYYIYKFAEGQLLVGVCGEELGSDSAIQRIEVQR